MVDFVKEANLNSKDIGLIDWLYGVEGIKYNWLVKSEPRHYYKENLVFWIAQEFVK